MLDSYRDKKRRSDLVEIIKNKGITDKMVLKAIGEIPRHLFFEDQVFRDKAYEDIAFPIGEGQTISQPYTVAYQTEQLQIKPRDKILEIGTGSGYQAAVLAHCKALVYTIERNKKLYQKTSSLLKSMSYSTIKTFFGDGFKGLPTFAPFDKVIVTAAAPYIPEDLLDQLKPNGIMIIPVGEGQIQKMMRIDKTFDGNLRKTILDNFSFVPMLKGKHF